MVIRVNYKKAVMLITFCKSIFVKLVLIFSLVRTPFFQAYCFNFFSGQYSIFVKDIVLICSL